MPKDPSWRSRALEGYKPSKPSPLSREVKDKQIDRFIDALRKQDGSACKMILEEGVNLELRDKDGGTPLHLAALHEDLESIKLLKTLGADLEAKDSYGDTPLATAAVTGKTEAVKALIKYGANVSGINLEDISGESRKLILAEQVRLIAGVARAAGVAKSVPPATSPVDTPPLAGSKRRAENQAPKEPVMSYKKALLQRARQDGLAAEAAPASPAVTPHVPSKGRGR